MPAGCIFAAAALGSAMNWTVLAIKPDASRVFESGPLYLNIVNSIFVSFLLLPLALFGSTDILSDERQEWCRNTFLCSLVGYNCKDLLWLIQQRNAMLFAHHFFCVVGVAAFLCDPPPSAHKLFIGSCGILECGSLASNIVGLAPNSVFSTRWFLKAMTASNAIGLAGVAGFAHANPFTPVTVYLEVTAVLVCYGRQVVSAAMVRKLRTKALASDSKQHAGAEIPLVPSSASLL
jgi:hypothetical protein